MKILAFAGSLRAGSLNRMLLTNALAALEGKAELDRLDLRDVAMPIYDGDLEAAQGPPEGARRFKARIAAADALLIATPEYNTSVPGGLKNVIDWASRPPDIPFKGKVALLLSASPGQFGAVRSLMTVRQILTALFVHVVPQAVSVSRADQAFDESGNLKEARTKASIEKACAELLRLTALLRA